MMSTNEIPKAIPSRTLAQSVLVNLVAQVLLSFSQPMLAQSQLPFPSAGPKSQALDETLRDIRDEGDKLTGKRTQGAVAPVRIGTNHLGGAKRLTSQRKEVAYVDAMLSRL